MQPVPLAIVVALDDEIRTVQSKMEIDARVHVRPALFTVGTLGAKPVVVARSGIGIPAMEAAAAYLLEHYRPAFCLHAGYCGGADPQDQPGDLLIASAVVDARSGTRTAADASRVPKLRKPKIAKNSEITPITVSASAAVSLTGTRTGIARSFSAKGTARVAPLNAPAKTLPSVIPI